MKTSAPFFGLFSAILVSLAPHSSYAWVNLSEWKKPKVFGLAPSADTAFISTTLQGKGQNADEPRMNKTSASLLGLYPMLNELVAGLNAGGSVATLENIPITGARQTLKTQSAWLEFAALYALQDNLSIYVSPGFSSKKTIASAGNTTETSATLTTYSVWSATDEIGLGLGLAGRKNARTQTLIPLVGGAWQPTPEFRLDGWLPVNLHARWKYTPRQAVFARLELAGDSAMSDKLTSGAKTDVQLLGAQMLLGWSIGMPIGFGTGFLRLDPSLGFFKGQLSQKFDNGQSDLNRTTPVNPLADIRLAVAF